MPSASMTAAPVRVSGLNTLNCPSSLDESASGGGPPELLDSTSGGGPDELLAPGLVFVGPEAFAGIGVLAAAAL